MANNGSVGPVEKGPVAEEEEENIFLFWPNIIGAL